MNDKILLSICMIVKDEEYYIKKCLESLSALIKEGIAELIIVDTGSIDRTVEICKKYTKNIYYKQWNNNFSEARNYSISLAKGEYIFIQDADQTIDKKSIDEFIKLFKTGKYKKYKTIYLKLRNYLDDELNKYSDLRFPLIFKNDGEFKYTGAVHNQPLFKEPIIYYDIQINHFGYIMNEEKKLAKFNRTASILKKELSKDPDNCYYRFQLARSYNSIGDYKNAMKQVEYYINLIPKEISKENLKYYRTAAQTFYLNNKFNKTIDICSNVLKVFPYFLDCLYLKGLSLAEKKFYEDSNYELKRYLEVLDKKLYMENVEIEMFSVASKYNAFKAIESNKRLIEFNNYIIKIKDNLKILLQSNIMEALKIIDELRSLKEYKDIRDVEFFSITSTIYFMNMNYDKALEEIYNGFIINDKNFDLIYNKACILEALGEYSESMDNYKLAKSLCNQEDVISMINKKLIEIEGMK